MKARLTWLAVAVLASRSEAQGPPMTHELRVDAVVAGRAAVEGGASLIVPAGVYARTMLTAAGGVVSRASGTAAVGRFEVVSRFLLDPYREWPYGLSVGAGVGVTNLAAPTAWKPYLACVVDLELKRTSGWTPAIQVGLGGGTRVGLGLRRSTGRWR